MFTVESPGGKKVYASFENLDKAVLYAKTRVKDDPELGAVEVYEHPPDEGGRYVGQATHIPDADWQSVVGWLWAGEKITLSGASIMRRIGLADLQEQTEKIERQAREFERLLAIEDFDGSEYAREQTSQARQWLRWAAENFTKAREQYSP